MIFYNYICSRVQKASKKGLLSFYPDPTLLLASYIFKQTYRCHLFRTFDNFQFFSYFYLEFYVHFLTIKTLQKSMILFVCLSNIWSLWMQHKTIYSSFPSQNFRQQTTFFTCRKRVFLPPPQKKSFDFRTKIMKIFYKHRMNEFISNP